MNQSNEEVDQTRKPQSPSDLEPQKLAEVEDKYKNSNSHTSDYAPYPKLDPKDVAPSPENWANLSTGSTTQSKPPGPSPIAGTAATTMPAESNPYVSPGPVAPSSSKSNLLQLLFNLLFCFKKINQLIGVSDLL
jgi:hypothetical protein